MKPELADYLFFTIATLLLLIACRLKKHRDSKRAKPSKEEKEGLLWLRKS